MANNENSVDVVPAGAEGPHLSISAHVVVQLGEELVTDTEQALLELAKNAYDADSESCEIAVDPDWVPDIDDELRRLFVVPQLGRVRVRDRGTGITPEAVEKGWLKVSSSVKRSFDGRIKATTDKGRTPVGDKGLGRLATMKIGNVLRMKTAIEGESVWRTVTFSWQDFTSERTLEQVPVFLGEDSVEPVDEPGTIIEIIGLHERQLWKDPTYVEKQLIPNLSALVTPFKSKDPFTISVHSSGIEHRLEYLDEAVLNLAAAKFEFNWDGERMSQKAFIAPILFRGDRSEDAARNYRELLAPEARAELLKWLSVDRKLVDRGLQTEVADPWLFSFDDELSGVPFPVERYFPGAQNPGPFSGTLHYFLFHQDVKEKLTTAGVPAATLQSMSQVAIFRDGFRVRAQKDWLRLSESATSGSSYYALRPANVVGYFMVSNAGNPNLIEKSDREGFVDTPAHRGFMTLGLRARDFANDILESSRIAVRNFQRSKLASTDSSQAQPTKNQLVKKLEGTRSAASSALGKIQAELTEARDALNEASQLPVGASLDQSFDASRALQTRLVNASIALEEASKKLEAQSNVSALIVELAKDEEDLSERLLDAAAVGLAARTLAHELHNYVRQFRAGLSLVVEENRKLKNPRLSSAVRQLNSVTREFSKVVATIDPLLPGARALKENIDVKSFIEEFVLARRAAAERYDVQMNLKSDQANGCSIRFNRTRFLQIVENLFQNSIYWLRHGPLPKKDLRQINVEVTECGFSWSDSGPGVRPSLESSILDPYISDKPRSEASGLGLHVVNTYLALEKASISLDPIRNALGRRYKFNIDLTGAKRNKESF